jgi:hypothetical protein
MQRSAAGTLVRSAEWWFATGPARDAGIVPVPPIRGLFTSHLEVTMVTRRIVTSACALCLAVPAAAVASPGTVPQKARGPYGITPATGAPTSAKAKGPYGIPPRTGPSITAVAKGPYGVTPVTGPPMTAKATGPYGITPLTGPPATAGATAHSAATARDTSTTGWRIAAIGEAGLLAALALGSVALVATRRRAPHIAT